MPVRNQSAWVGICSSTSAAAAPCRSTWATEGTATQAPSRPAAQPPSRLPPQPGTDAVVAQFAFDHRFAGWRGAALLRDEACRCGSARLPYLVVYTPAHLPFYCVEPVSHVNNALQMTEPTARGSCDLAAGATLGAFLGLKSRPRD